MKLKDDIVFKIIQFKMGLAYYKFSLKDSHGVYPECADSRMSEVIMWNCPEKCGCAFTTEQANEILTLLDKLKSEIEDEDLNWWNEPVGIVPKYFLKLCGGGNSTNTDSPSE